MRHLVPVIVLFAACAPASDTVPAAGGFGPIADGPPIAIKLPAPEMQVSGGTSDEFEALGVSAATLEAEIVGLVSRTRMVLTFSNPHDRVLEGELEFPLPEDATVSGYALDINGQLVDAVVVEKEKARVVFEKEVRKGVDPGIVEVVGGNTFRTRVYPIPAKGQRTIAVEYVRQLDVWQERALYQLPINFTSALKNLTLKIGVPNSPATPQIEFDGIPEVPLTTDGDTQVGELDLDGETLSGRVAVWLPRSKRSVAVEQLPSGDETHFMVVEPLGKFVAEASARPVSTVTIFWDVSHSRGNAAHERVLAGFEAYFRALGRNDVTVELVLFANDIVGRKTLRVGATDISALRAGVEGVSYDGGTQLAAISPSANDTPPDVYFLVSDGLSNFGHAEPTGLRAPLYAVSVGQQTNPVFLQHLAESSGGAYFNVGNTDPSILASAVAAAPLAVTKIEVKNGEVGALLPAAGRPVGRQLNISGKLKSVQATIVVTLGRGSETLRTLTYELDSAHATVGGTVARVWAQNEASRLAAFPKQNKKALVALGKKYGLVTPGTSLIVLERLEQYVEHDIRPPASLTDMRAEFDRQAENKRVIAQKDRSQKLERMVGLWKKRIEWWNTEFKPVEEKKDKKPAKEYGTGAGRMESRPATSTPRPSLRQERSRRSLSKKSVSPKTKMAPSSAADELESELDDMAAQPEPDPQPSIELKPWDPDTPYLAAIKAAAPADAYATYLAQKKTFGASPAFYLDCADYFFRSKDKNQLHALRILSTVAELEIEDAPLIRVVAHRLAQLDRLELSRLLFERVLDWRAEEPQSYRDLALVLARQQKYERALALLARVVMNTWDRFREIELIALMELNNIIPAARAAGVTDIPIDERLIALLDVDVRISLSWDADLTDIDMWVMEPTGEKAYYSNNRTKIGGLVSRDFTQGYGPEEYLIRKAIPGTYTVKANYYGSRAQTLTGAVTVQLDLYTNYGRPNEQRKSITLRLNKTRETLTVGELTF